MTGEEILERARAIVGPRPAPFRGEQENWEDQVSAACLAIVERSRGYRRDPVKAARMERRRQRTINAAEREMFASITGEDLADD